jgi:putative membrane protein insertion efficiency factor
MAPLRVRLSRVPVTLLIAAVRAYRYFLSPWLGSGCRFEPTCSAYALQALEGHGAAAGTYITLTRLVRCHPWCDGGHDPVPATLGGLFTRRPSPTQDSTSP